MREERPDVAGLQEALRFQLDEIAAAVPGYVELGGGRDDGKTRGEYSPLLVSTSHFEVIYLPHRLAFGRPKVPGSTSWGNTLPRIHTSAVLRNGGRDRADPARAQHPPRPPVRAQSVKVSRIPGRTNSCVGSGGTRGAHRRLQRHTRHPSLRILLAPRDAGGAGLLDAVAAVEPTLATFGTFHNWSDRTDGPRIDFILVRPRGRLVAAHVRPDQGRPYASDHRLVAVEWDFQP